MALFSEINWTIPQLVALAVVATASFAILGRALRRLLEERKPFRELPMPKGNHFIFGHAQSAIADSSWKESFNKITVDYANEYGQVGIWLLRSRVLSLNSVADARKVLNAEHERHPHMFTRYFNRHFMGDRSLIFLDGREWKFHRGTINRAFNPKFMKESRSGMQEVAETMVTSLRKQIKQSQGMKEFNIEPLIKMITLDVFGRISLSTDLGLCRTLEPSPLVRAFEYILNGSVARMRDPFKPKNIFFWLPFEQNIRHKYERSLIRTFIADLINEKRKSCNVKKNTDLLSHLIQAHKEAQSGDLKAEDMSDEAITDGLMTILFAGYDTTSVTLTFALYLLAQNQDIQDRCVEEIKNTNIIENTDDLVYCKAVITETVRMYPAAVRTTRYLTKDIELSGGFIAPAGVRVAIPIWSIHHDPKNFPFPEEFRPDRWAKRSADKSRWGERDVWEDDAASSIPAGDRKAILAFSAGGRSCVGQKVAMQEAVVVLATLLKSLKFLPVPGYEFDTTIKDLFLKPKNGMPLKMEARK